MTPHRPPFTATSSRRRARPRHQQAPRLHLLGLVLVTMTLSALFAACGGGGPSSQSLVLYSGQHVQTTQSLVAAFEKSTGIHVSVRFNDESVFANEIVEEASHPKADLFYTENSPALEYLQERGLLAPVSASTLANVPAKYDSPEGDWVGVSARVSLLIYNPHVIPASDLPASVLQLASKRYRGLLALAPGETDFQPIVTAVARAYGTGRALDWLKGLKANAAGHIYPDNETITAQVNRGAAGLGVINQYYWYRLGAEVGAGSIRSKLAFFAPHDPGYVVDISGAAVLKSSKHKAAAEAFLAFLVSKQAQEIIAHSESFEYPIAHGVQPSAHEVPFGQLQPYPITIAQLGDGSLALSLLQKANLL